MTIPIFESHQIRYASVHAYLGTHLHFLNSGSPSMNHDHIVLIITMLFGGFNTYNAHTWFYYTMTLFALTELISFMTVDILRVSAGEKRKVVNEGKRNGLTVCDQKWLQKHNENPCWCSSRLSHYKLKYTPKKTSRSHQKRSVTRMKLTIDEKCVSEKTKGWDQKGKETRMKEKKSH